VRPDQGYDRHAIHRLSARASGPLVRVRLERQLKVQVMAATGGVQTKAAQKLSINCNTLHKKPKEYDLDDSEPAGA
jgi:DNA-binding NtrC family response regulator